MRHAVKTVVLASLVILASVVGILYESSEVGRQAAPAAATSAAPAPTGTVRADMFQKMPLYFIENRGQLDPRVAYYVQGQDKTIYFTKEGLTLALTDREREKVAPKGKLEKALLSRPETGPNAPRASRWVVKLDFVGANPDVKITAEEKTAAIVSYFKGRPEEWKTGLATFNRVVYSDLWPGIDLVYSGTVDRLKYSFVVKPGADPDRIRLAYRGATNVGLSEAGRLEVETPAGGFQDEKPYSYQEVSGRRVEIETAYALASSAKDDTRTYGFHVASYDRSKPLVLDPAVLVYAGYIGGSGTVEQGVGIAVDTSGNAYVTGVTTSTEATFPVTVGPDLTYNGGIEDAFVAKVNAAGTALVYAGYIGGSGATLGVGIAVDSSGNAYVSGLTQSTEATFPVTIGPDLTYNGGIADAFVAKVNAAGTALVYCGYIGGSGDDQGYGIAVDISGSAYVTGFTGSTEATFPPTVGPDLTYNGGIRDAFVAKVNSAGTGLDYAGYIGGSGDDRGRGIAVDGSGNAYVTGFTDSTEATFPVTVGPDLTFNGVGDVFVAKVNSAGTALVYAGYIGGSGNDAGGGIAVDISGNAYVAGFTASTEATFPVNVGPDLTFNGVGDVFVAKVDPAGTALVYAGYIGGSGNDSGSGIAVDNSGNAYVTGGTQSSESTFPVIGGPDLTYNGGGDAFAAKVNSSGNALTYAGYIGGSGADVGFGIAVDISGNAYVAGDTQSSEATFPITVGPDLTYNGGRDAFVAKIAFICPTLTLSPSTLPDGTTSIFYFEEISASGGSAPYTFEVTSGSLPPGLGFSTDGPQTFISGTPTTAGSFPFTVTATDADGCTGSQSYTITIAPCLTLSPPVLPNGVVGVSYNQTITASGSAPPPYTFSVTAGSLPPGLTLSSGGALSGTPTTAGSYSFTVTATDQNQCSGIQGYTVSISCPAITLSPSALPGGAVGSSYGQTITASGGTAPYTFSVASGSLPPGLSLSSGGVLSGTPTSGGSHSFTVTATDANQCTGSQSYTVSIAGCGTVTVSPSVLFEGFVGVAYRRVLSGNGGTGPYSFSLTSGVLPPGLTLSGGVISGTPTAAGTYTFRISVVDANECASSRTYTLTISCRPAALSPPILPSASQGVVYPQTLTVLGGPGPYTFSVTGGALSNGLTLLPSGAFSGAPIEIGTFSFAVTATDADGCTAVQNYTLTVCAALTLSPAALPGAMVGALYTQTIVASGGTGPYVFAATGLPSSLTLDSASGLLSGTPTASGTFTFTVTATDAGGCSGTATYTLSVCVAGLTLSPGTLPAGAVGTAYGQTVVASGGAPPYAFAVTSGALPAGLTLSPAGALSGVPTVAGLFSFAVTATDAGGCSGTATYTLSVCVAGLTLSPGTLPAGTAGTAYGQTLVASGGAPPYAFAVTSGALPAGLTLSPAGALSGVPTAAGLFSFAVTATDVNGCPGVGTYALRVCPVVAIAPTTLPEGAVGTAYSQALTASGGGPYTFAASGSLPPGLTLSSTGVLSGTPTQRGSFSFTATATDVNGCPGLQGYTVVVTDAPPAISDLNLAPGDGGSFGLSVTGSGFVSGAVVVVNGVSYPTTFVSPTLVTVVLPASAVPATGSITVTVTNPGATGGTSNLATLTFCSPPGVPRNPTIEPAGNPTGPITATDFLRVRWDAPATGPAPAFYEFRINGDSWSAPVFGTSALALPRGTNDPITLYVRAHCNAEVSSPAASSPTYSLAPPVANFTFSSARVGSPITFTDTSSPQATSWLWIFDDGATSILQSPTHTFTTAGTHRVALIASNGSGSDQEIKDVPVSASTSGGGAVTSSLRPFERSEAGRWRLAQVAISGAEPVWLELTSEATEEAIVYLRFIDSEGWVVLERRLSVAPGQTAVNDVRAYGLEGLYTLEVVSSHKITPALAESRVQPEFERRNPDESP